MFTTVPLNAATGLDAPVAKLMHENPVRVPGQMPIAAAARTMLAQRIHAVIVIDDSGVELGWVTTRGMLHNTPRDWSGATAQDAISEAIVSVAPDATMRAALEALLAGGVSHILVRPPAGGPAIGVVSDFDLLALLCAPAA